VTSADYDPGPIQKVSCEPVGERWTLVLTCDIDHAVDAVWAVITEPEQLRQWAPYTADRPLNHTGAVQLDDNHRSDGPAAPAQVLACEAPQLLEHSWEVDVLRWELSPTGTGTRVTLRHTLDDRHLVPEVAAGWHICLDAAAALLDGNPFGPVLGEDAMSYGWRALAEKYAEELGIYQSPGR
jgi:uncharacterized protein YndB with AHSA1/START domain